MRNGSRYPPSGMLYRQKTLLLQWGSRNLFPLRRFPIGRKYLRPMLHRLGLIQNSEEDKQR